MRRRATRSRILKKPSRARGGDRARERRQPRGHRDLVRRRGADRPEKQDHPPLGRRGTRPSAPSDQRTVSTHIFGEICPKEGKAVCLIRPKCNTEAMQSHLDEIAKDVEPGSRTVLLLDKAGWHTSPKFDVPEKSHGPAAARQMPRAQTQLRSYGSSCATTGSQTGPSQPRRHRRSLLRRLEQAPRPTLARHVHRSPKMGP
jgi:hypothetical protein